MIYSTFFFIGNMKHCHKKCTGRAGVKKGTSQSGLKDGEKSYTQMQEIRTKILVELHLHFFSWEYHKLWYSHSVHFKASSLQFFQKSSNLVDIKYHVYFINQEIFSHLYVFSALDSITFTCESLKVLVWNHPFLKFHSRQNLKSALSAIQVYHYKVPL